MYAVLLITWLFSTRLAGQNKRNFTWAVGLICLWLVQALRDWHVGTDLKVYVPAFVSGWRDVYDMEGGYMWINKILYSVTHDPNYFLAIMSGLFLLPISLVYRRFSKDIILSYIIFASFVVYHFSFSGIRQAIAIGIIVYSYKYVDNHKFIKFTICVIAASLMHVSSVIFAIFYPLCNMLKMTNKKYIITAVIAFFVVTMLKPLLEIMLPLIFGEGKFIHYIDKEVVPAYNLMLIMIVIFLFTFIVKNPSKALRDYRMACFCAIMSQTLGLISSSGSRIAFYFIPFLALAIPQTISESDLSRANKMLMASGFAAFMMFFFFYAYSDGYLEVVPYKFYWE